MRARASRLNLGIFYNVSAQDNAPNRVCIIIYGPRHNNRFLDKVNLRVPNPILISTNTQID